METTSLSYNYVKGGYTDVDCWPLYSRECVAPGEVSTGYQDEFISGEVGQPLEQAVQGGSGVAIPGDI